MPRGPATKVPSISPTGDQLLLEQQSISRRDAPATPDQQKELRQQYGRSSP
jgi:hypothetical protein